MRFPHDLFGFPMTAGLWYVVIIVVAIFIFWLLQKVFSNLVKDFAGGVIIFALIVVFIFVATNLVSGSDLISSGFDNWFQNIFR